MRPTLVNLQALRGVACLLVVALHVAEWESLLGLSFSPARPFRFVGHYGVDLFFALSGFILTYSHACRPGGRFSLRSYLVSRFRRIYPTYWVALAAGIGVSWVFAGDAAFGPEWAGQLLDMALLLPGQNYPVWLPVSWTLVYEVMFYLVLGILLVIPRRPAFVLAAAWAGAVVARAVAGWSPSSPALDHASSPLILEFLAGAAAAFCLDQPRRYPVAAAGLAAVWWSVGFFAAFDPKDPLAGFLDPRVRVLTVAIPAALLVYAAASWDRSGVVAPRWLAWVGDRSYSIYLIHAIVNPVVVYATIQVGWSHTRVPHVLWLGLLFWSGVGSGVVFYWLVEARVMAWGKRARKPTPAPAPEVSSPVLRRAA